MPKLSFFTQSIAMDLGTANTIIMQDNQVIIDQPSVVAIRTSDDTAIAVGKKASAMIDRGEERIRTIRPLKDGVISDYKACEKMIRGLIDMMPKKPDKFQIQFHVADDPLHSVAKGTCLVLENTDNFSFLIRN